MKRNIRLFVLINILLVPLFVGMSKADTFYFNDSNEFGGWTGPATSGYGSVEITKNLSGGLDFVVSANTDYFSSSSGTGLTWDAFLFNIDGNDPFDISDVTITEPGTWKILNNKGNGGYGKFEFKLKGTKIGKNEVNPLLFSINNASLTIADLIANTSTKGWMFAGHLRRFDAMRNEDGSRVRSTWLGAGNSPEPVPEPSTMLLLGTGVAGLAALGRKRKK